MIRTALGLTTLVAILIAAGCGSSAQRKANARLRDDNATLQAQVDALQLQLAEAHAQSQAVAEQDLRVARHASIPQVARIAVASSSGLDPSPPSEGPVLQVLISAVDGRNRPIQLAGELSVQVLQPQADGDAVLVAQATLDPAQVRNAWRGSAFRQRWLVELPLKPSIPLGELIVHVRYDDLRSRATLRATGTIDAPVAD
ncbi:MAG: hypothetical protein MK074_08270 [Phycisphaerales bacterium]|nr:hypothetical protein [Phycisphaerales bacterium]